MPDGNLAQSTQSWTGVGVHPTPANLVRGFAHAVVASIMRRHCPGTSLTVLDACAGDGRLGHAVSKRLTRLGYHVTLTLVEADADRLPNLLVPYAVNCVVANFYTFGTQKRFDVVVSNPPYLALGRAEAKRLDLDWDHVLDFGRNLYGLALEKCLSICEPHGVVGFLAPHGWLRNWHGVGLRALVHRAVKSVDIYASSSRRLFPGVNQDIAAQVFELREQVIERATAAVRISYDLSTFDNIDLPPSPPARSHTAPRVRVGPFVWNREKELLAARATKLPVVYGGNISTDGKLQMNVQRYRGRQFLAKSRVPPSYISRGPCLLIKRSLRGAPGKWKLDSAIVIQPSPFVAENHVIVVELPIDYGHAAIYQFCSIIIRLIESKHRHHGHPNVSVALVRHVLEQSVTKTI